MTYKILIPFTLAVLTGPPIVRAQPVTWTFQGVTWVSQVPNGPATRPPLTGSFTVDGTTGALISWDITGLAHYFTSAHGSGEYVPNLPGAPPFYNFTVGIAPNDPTRAALLVSLPNPLPAAGGTVNLFVAPFPYGAQEICGGQCIFSGNFSVVSGVVTSCQVNVARFGQCQINTLPFHWGKEQYAYHVGKTICGLGCVLTSLSMDLVSQFTPQVPCYPNLGFTNCGNQPLIANDPGTLNTFMTRLTFLPDYNVNNDVDPFMTTLDLGFQLNKALVFNGPGSVTGTSDANGTPVNGDPVRDYLDRALCGGHPVIVRVTGADGKFAHHKVLVTGKDGDDYLINDPAGAAPGSSGTNIFYCPNSVILIPKPCSRLSEYGKFNIVGFVSDPPTDRSDLDIKVDTVAELLVVDALGRRTGADSVSGSELNEIPQSTYFVDATDDEETGEPPTSTMHLVNAFQPTAGTYRVTISGVQLGTYTLEVSWASSDGAIQPKILVPGVARVGSISTFQIQYSPMPGASLTAARVASFQSTLADIANSLQLALIDNAGIANSLTRKINSADSAVAEHENDDAKEAMNAFKHEVSAQTGKHITGVAPQVLQEDADSLISQLH
jgi:hypothetical protein